MTAEKSLLTIRSDGIYHGLPVFPENVGGLTAIITGANGISGTHMICKAKTDRTSLSVHPVHHLSASFA